ncbi:MAG TPA: hypothetical protein VK427_07530 [Kofleriaceae bacterium]|nr:hypothetical protein [Kofleriaceae bacterium]
MKAVVALSLAVSLAACFPNSGKHSTYAKIVEGVAIVGGITLLYSANSGADCDQMTGIDDDPAACRDTARMTSGIGLGLILAGLAGFVATVSVEPGDKPAPSPTAIKPTAIAPTPIAPPPAAPVPAN